MIDQDLYAFWIYDQPPYYIGAKIKRFLPNGLVEVEGFPGSRGMKPVAILPDDDGVRALNELRQLGDETTAKLRVIRGTCHTRAEEIMRMRTSVED